MEIIQKLHREGITILLITHFMDEVCESRQVIIMDEGRIVLDGEPAQVFRYAEESKR